MTNRAMPGAMPDRIPAPRARRLGRSIPAAGMLGFVLLVPARAAAGTDLPAPGIQSDTPPPRYPPVALVVGGHVGMLFGKATTRELSDVVRNESATALAGVQFGPRYRVSPLLSFGARGAVSFAGASRWWQAELDARFHALGAQHPDLWLGIDGVVVAVAEALEADELGPATTLTRTAPVAGVGIGIDFELARFLAVGPELRGFVVPFGAAAQLPDRGTSYGTQLGAALAVTATVLFRD